MVGAGAGAGLRGSGRVVAVEPAGVVGIFSVWPARMNARESSPLAATTAATVVR